MYPDDPFEKSPSTIVAEIFGVSGESLYQTIFEAAPCGILLVGQDETIMLANRNAQNILRSTWALRGRKVVEFVPEDKKPLHQKAVNMFFSNPNVQPIKVNDGNPVRIVCDKEECVQVCLHVAPAMYHNTKIAVVMMQEAT